MYTSSDMALQRSMRMRTLYSDLPCERARDRFSLRNRKLRNVILALIRGIHSLKLARLHAKAHQGQLLLRCSCWPSDSYRSIQLHTWDPHPKPDVGTIVQLWAIETGRQLQRPPCPTKSYGKTKYSSAQRVDHHGIRPRAKLYRAMSSVSQEVVPVARPTSQHPF
jgi:hypothetical protein